MPIMLGVEYTGGRCGFHALSVFLNSTVVSASPRVPMGTGFAMLRDYRDDAKARKWLDVWTLLVALAWDRRMTTEPPRSQFSCFVVKFSLDNIYCVSYSVRRTLCLA